MINGETVLMGFTYPSQANFKMASLLIQYGADVNIKAKDGITALKNARKVADKDVEKLSIKYGARE